MGSFWNNQKRGAGPPPGSQKGPWRGPTLGRAGHPPSCPVWPLDAPLRLYLPLRVETPKQEPFSRNPLCSAAAAVFRSGLPGEAALAPCRKEITPPGDHP